MFLSLFSKLACSNKKRECASPTSVLCLSTRVLQHFKHFNKVLFKGCVTMCYKLAQIMKTWKNEVVSVFSTAFTNASPGTSLLAKYPRLVCLVSRIFFPIQVKPLLRQIDTQPLKGSMSSSPRLPYQTEVIAIAAALGPTAAETNEETQPSFQIHPRATDVSTLWEIYLQHLFVVVFN